MTEIVLPLDETRTMRVQVDNHSMRVSGVPTHVALTVFFNGQAVRVHIPSREARALADALSHAADQVVPL